jgi:hypothetical protein
VFASSGQILSAKILFFKYSSLLRLVDWSMCNLLFSMKRFNNELDSKNECDESAKILPITAAVQG